MYDLRYKPNLQQPGEIPNLFRFADGVLYFRENLKYKDQKWYQKGDDGKWYFIGYSGVPSSPVDELIDNPLFLNVYEEVEKEEQVR